MRDFSYAQANKPADVVAALAGADSSHETMLVAGGTELLNWMRLGISDPLRVLDISHIPQLAGIELAGDTLKIGALATLNAVGENDLVNEHAAVLAQACLKAASPQIRNRATLGGSCRRRVAPTFDRNHRSLGAATSASPAAVALLARG